MSKNQSKKLVNVFSILFYIILINLSLLSLPSLGVSAITAEQRQEIEGLRSKLNEAFDKNAPKGVIVQPTWTQGKPDQKQNVKVQVTAQNRQETAAIRATIDQAKAQDTYATNGEGSNSQNIKNLEASLAMKEKGKDVVQKMMGATQEPQESEHVGSGTPNEKNEGDKKRPNIITANLGEDSAIDIRKLQRLEVAKRRTKENLVLKYIEEDFSFDLGDEVQEWEHIVHGGQEYFIGRRLTDLLVVHKDTAKYEKAMLLDVGHPISYLETYNYWNAEQQEQEGVILIATQDRVLWYRANRETKQIELYWDWMVGNTITGLTHFTLDNKDYLTVSSNQSSLMGHYALNIYEYKLESKEFWIAQRLQLAYSCEEVTVLNTGRDVILAIPQNNTAAIFTFNPNEADLSHIRFQLKRSVPAEGILTIAGFKMGGRSYLALTGYQPQILLYQQGDFVSKTILGQNFGLVELFFPIAVRTYRDDLILLVQHRVDFATHTLTVVETLIWDGEAFETSIPVPCHLGKHVVYGVSCMLDIQRDEGLKGAALLRRGDDISVIVPRFKAESGLFKFHTELLAKNSELLDLQEIFSFLKDWVKEQDDLVAQAQAFLNMPDDQISTTQPDLSNLDSLTTPEFELQIGEIGEIYVNDYKWSMEDSNINLEYLIQNLEDLDRNIATGRQRRQLDDVKYEELTFDQVEVEHLEIENLNGQPFYIQNGQLDFEGLVQFNELEVLDNIVEIKKRLVEDVFEMEGDLEFDFINDLAWADIKDNLVFRTEPQEFDSLNVLGEVIAEGLLTIKTLNSLEFPDEYLLSTGPAASIVKAEKYFKNTLAASAVDMDGTINGKNPLDAITLMDTQEWLGFPTFYHLEISENLELNGTAHGRNAEKFPQNPSLNDSNLIAASCQFQELYVNGPLIVKGQVDDKPLGSLLKDIILKPEDPEQEILVSSPKSFGLVMFPIDFELEENTINQLPVNEFVTVHTKQFLNISQLEGYVYFYNLTLNGSYDGVRIEDILKEAIILDKPIDLGTTELIFSDHVKMEDLAVIQTINGNLIKNNLQSLQEDLVLDSVEFENLLAHQADFSHDILGSGKLNNIDLHSFVHERSWHEPPIKGNIFLNELILDKGLRTDELHGIKAEYLMDFIKNIDELPNMVLNGQIQVDHITVTEDVHVHRLNGQMFDEDIQFFAIWLNRPNYLSTNIKFKDQLKIKGHLNVVGNFRGFNMPDVIDDMIIRSPNSTLEIKAPKSFLKHVTVLQNSHLKALNGLPIENIAWTTKDHNIFKGSLNIKGNLIAQHVELEGLVNNKSLKDLENLLYFDDKLQNFVLKNSVQFDQSLFLDDLTVLKDFNDIPNLEDFFQNLIYKNNKCKLKGKNTFTGRVTMEEGAYISQLNGHDLENLFNNLVLRHGSQPVIIKGPVIFEDSVKAPMITIGKSLEVSDISGCNIEDWLTDSLRVDQDQNIPHYLQCAPGSLDGNSFDVHFINDINMSGILTLNTPQTFNTSVNFSEVFVKGFISSQDGLVNGINLDEEYNNTLMTSGNQHITTPLSIQSITVLGDLTVKGLVNENKDLQDVATLEDNLVLESPLYFQSISSPKVIVKDLVTGLDLEKWFQSVVKFSDKMPQVIKGNWSAQSLTVKSGPNDFQYMINGYEPWQYNSYIRTSRSNNKEEEYICKILREIWSEFEQKSVYLKYIEEADEINLDLLKQFKENNSFSRKMFFMKTLQDDILMVNLNCLTYVFKWLKDEKRFKYSNFYESGPINQVIGLTSSNNSSDFQFITNWHQTDSSNCSLKGLHIWKTENDRVFLERSLATKVEEFHKHNSKNSTLLLLDTDHINELDLKTYEIKQKFKKPNSTNETLYRFVPQPQNEDIILTNGLNMLVISNNLKGKFKKSTQSHLLDTTSIQFSKDLQSESILKPNTSLTRDFVFADFQKVVERIIVDLALRLNQQINITQLSIPETDLFDEHLVPDFLAIMEELHKQQIYPKDTFQINFDNITIPENPAQILAARLVHITWPVIIEIEEIHSYLRSNKTHDHPLCACISQSLGFLIRDVLLLANHNKSSNGTHDYTTELSNVIKRIRTFEKDLEEFVKALKLHKDQNTTTTTKKEDRKENEENLDYSPTNLDSRIFSQTPDNMLFVEHSHLPGLNKGEMLSLTVGSLTNSRNLMAVTNNETPLIPSLNPGIFIYHEGFKPHIYQVIEAKQPRSLQYLRVQQETLLFFIENCCHVQIYRYQGAKGFEKYAEIQSKTKISQILSVTVRESEGLMKFYLILLLENKIKFYDIIIEGAYEEPPPLPLNCL